MNYGRNFGFLASPKGAQRDGRFKVPTTGTAIPLGAPVKADLGEAPDALGLQPVELATGAQAPIKGLSGILVFEYKGMEGFAGDDPYLTTVSDKDTAPLGAAVQVVSGDAVKVWLKNTNDVVFLENRTYAGRTMVSEGAGATPNVDVGSFLTPGAGTDADGYWAVTTNAAQAWLVVTAVDDARGEIQARFLF